MILNTDFRIVGNNPYYTSTSVYCHLWGLWHEIVLGWSIGFWLLKYSQNYNSVISKISILYSISLCGSHNKQGTYLALVFIKQVFFFIKGNASYLFHVNVWKHLTQSNRMEGFIYLFMYLFQLYLHSSPRLQQLSKIWEKVICNKNYF